MKQKRTNKASTKPSQPAEAVYQEQLPEAPTFTYPIDRDVPLPVDTGTSYVGRFHNEYTIRLAAPILKPGLTITTVVTEEYLVEATARAMTAASDINAEQEVI